VKSTRTYAATVDRQLGIRYVRINIELNLTYEEAIWWLNLALDGNNRTGTTTGSTPPGFTYSLAPNSATDDLDTCTIKAGDPGNPYKFSRCAVNKMTMRWNPLQGGDTCWRMVAELWAIFVGTTTFDSPADITRNKILARGTKVYIDEPGGTIMTTQILNKIRSGNIVIDNQLEEKVWSESVTDPMGDFARGEQLVTGEIVMEYQDDVEFGKMRAGTTRKLAIVQTGANIGATPTTDYRWQIQVPNAKYMAPTLGKAGQNKIITLPWVGQWSSAAPQPILVSDVIAAGTVTA
jgi:hypothetical protein